MKVPYSEELATHTGPESCAGDGNGIGETLTGVRAGWVLSLERTGKDLGECWNEDLFGAAQQSHAAVRAGFRRGTQFMVIRESAALTEIEGDGRAAADAQPLCRITAMAYYMPPQPNRKQMHIHDATAHPTPPCAPDRPNWRS